MDQATEVDQLVTLYLAWVEPRKKYNTWRLYRDRLAPFRIHFAGRAWASLLPLEIDAYLLAVNRWPDGRRKAPDTIRANVIALEQLQKFALTKAGIEKIVISDLEKPVGRWRERMPTATELAALMANSSKEFAMVYQALRVSGARPHELARATCADWDRDAGVITLFDHKTAEKSKRPRVIAVGTKLQELLLESLNGRTEGPLFRGPRGRRWTSASLGQTFARVRVAAGVDAEVKLYSARHEFGTACCDAIGREATADQMGHADTKTTRRYDHVTKSKLRSNQDAVNL